MDLYLYMTLGKAVQKFRFLQIFRPGSHQVRHSKLFERILNPEMSFHLIFHLLPLWHCLGISGFQSFSIEDQTGNRLLFQRPNPFVLF